MQPLSDLKEELIVVARIGLYIVSGRAVAGGWMPPDLVPEFVSPATAEAAVGLALALGTFIWYLGSKARAALKQAASDLRDTFR